MNIRAELIQSAITAFTLVFFTGNAFDRIRGIVERQNEKPLSGSEKMQEALKEAEVIGLILAEWALRLGIELAVAYLKQEASKQAA